MGKYRKLVMEEHVDVDEAAKKLPDVAYICITDTEGIIHLKTLHHLQFINPTSLYRIRFNQMTLYKLRFKSTYLRAFLYLSAQSLPRK